MNNCWICKRKNGEKTFLFHTVFESNRCTMLQIRYINSSEELGYALIQ